MFHFAVGYTARAEETSAYSTEQEAIALLNNKAIADDVNAFLFR